MRKAMSISLAQLGQHDRLAHVGHALSRHAYFLSRPTVLVSLITGLAALLRTYRLGAKSLWLDEALLYWFAHGDLEQVLEQNAAYNSAPPLFALLLHSVMSIGTSEEALRAISCVAGIAAVPAIYLLAREFVSKEWASFAAVLAAVAPSQIQYSQEVREYSLTFLLAIVMLLVFCRFLKRPTWGSALFLSLVVSFSLFTQYGLALLFFAINLVFFAALFRIDRPKHAMILWFAVLLVASVAVVAVYHLSLKHHWVPGGRAAYYLPDAYWNGSVRSLFRMAILNTETIFKFALPTQLLILACGLGVVEVVRGERRQWTALGLLIVPVAVTLFMSILRAYPYLGTRQTIFLTPMIYVFAALGMAFLRRQRGNQAVIVISTVLLVGYGLKETALYYPSSGPQNIRPIVARLLSSGSEGDRIYVHYGAAPAFSYYFQQQTRPWIAGVNRREDPEKFFQELDTVLAERTKLWLVFSHIDEDERQNTLIYISDRRRFDLVQKEEGAWLYVVQ
jgi:uncharacterized membrane protein